MEYSGSQKYKIPASIPLRQHIQNLVWKSSVLLNDVSLSDTEGE